MTTKDYRRLVSEAHHAVSNALRFGRLARESCQVCGYYLVEAHHADYRQPLQVMWLCKKHHRAEHAGKSHAYQFLGAESFEPRPVNWGAGSRIRPEVA